MISAVVALLVALATSLFESRRHSKQLRHDLEMQARDLAIQRERLDREHQTELMVGRAIERLLTDPRYQMRTFDAVKARLGGFSDEELRQLLVQSGALRYKGEKGEELWGLDQRPTTDAPS